MNTSISKLEHNNAAALITGEGTTLTITGDSSSYGGSFGGTVTVDYTGGGTFTLGNSDKTVALTPAALPRMPLLKSAAERFPCFPAMSTGPRSWSWGTAPR